MRPLTRISLFGIRLATCVLIVYWTLLFTGTHLPKLPDLPTQITDKMLHFGAFFGLSILLCWVVPTRQQPLRKFLIVATVAISYAIFDELTQGFVRGRTTDIKDFVADSLGVLSAITVYATARLLLPEWTHGDSPLSGRSTQARSDAVSAQASRDQAQPSRPRAMSIDQDSINVA